MKNEVKESNIRKTWKSFGKKKWPMQSDLWLRRKNEKELTPS